MNGVLRLNTMTNEGTKRKKGRPLEWILDEKITEAHQVILDLEKQNPKIFAAEVF
jgi:hypothetical protein